MLKQLRNAALGAGACLIASAAPAAACNAPPGLTFHEYEARCRPTMMQMHRIHGRSFSYLHYVRSWYGRYLQRTQGR